jgi:CBS domain-containing protein
MMDNVKVSDIMTRNVVTVEPDEEVVFAFEKLMKHKISAMPVMDNNKMVGIVTATDLGHNLILDKYTLGTKVIDVMVKQVAFVRPEDPVTEAISEMNENAPGDSIINQLPVLDHGKLVGIISDGDIISELKKELS